MTNKPVCPLCSEGHLTEVYKYRETPKGKTLKWVFSICSNCGVEQTSSEQMDFNKYLNIKHWGDLTYEQL